MKEIARDHPVEYIKFHKGMHALRYILADRGDFFLVFVCNVLQCSAMFS